MKLPKKTIIAVVLVGGAVYGLYRLSSYWQELSKPKYREAEVTRGAVVAVVNATGTVQPVLTVTVGSFVSGPIKKLNADYNKEVAKGDLLALIDPAIYQANLDQAQALLATRNGELKSAQALYEQAKNDYKRALDLFAQNPSFIAPTEIDKYRYSAESLRAQVAVAVANVKQADANLKTAETNLAYTEIRAPVDGIIIDRKVSEGQTVAASFQTPELFTVGPNMRKKMNIIASVDEADIGRVSEAEKRKLPVHFTVDSYPLDLFEGKISQIRLSATTTQNVVTYPVVVETTNADLKLKPSMTASLSFEVDQIADGLRLPNAALRFYPQRDKVRPEDRKILEGMTPPEATDNDTPATKLAAKEKAQGRKDAHKRHVWVVDGDFLRAVPVTTGMSDSKWTELISGDLREGDRLVTGVQTSDQ